jgi:tetratricopeptide (TPR) repeat protein
MPGFDARQQFEAAFRALIAAIEMQRELSVVYVFADSNRAADEFLDRFKASLRVRAIALSLRRDANPESLRDAVDSVHSVAPVEKEVVVISALGFGKEWDQARHHLLARLNEARHLLEQNFRQTLVLLLPASAKAGAAGIAPDMWSIRKAVLDVPDDSFSAVALGALARDDVNAIVVPKKPLPISLQRQWDDLQTALTTPAGAPFRMGPWGALLDQLIEAGDVRARGAALSIRDRLANEVSLDAAPDQVAMRDLSVSHERVGDAARALGRHDEALAAYREGKVLSERIVAEYGENREALRDLFISHYKVGDAARALGRHDEALIEYRASAAAADAMRDRFGDDEDSLSQLASVWLEMKRLGEANVSVEKQRDLRKIVRQLARAFPENSRYRSWMDELQLDT